MEEGAAVAAYVAAPLCGEAKRELEREGARAGEVRVRVICLADARSGGRLSLATVGAGARRATEDSTTVAYVEQTGPAARFSKPILESAAIAWIASDSGAAAMSRLLGAIRDASSDSLRESVRETLQQP